MRFGIRAAHSPEFSIKLRELLCGGCGLLLGCRFLEIYPDDPDDKGEGEDGQRSSDEDSDDGDGDLRARNAARKELLQTFFLAVPYLYCAKADGSVAPDQDVIMERIIRPPAPKDWPRDFVTVYACTGKHHRRFSRTPLPASSSI